MDAAELWETGDINQEKTLESKTQSKVATKVEWGMNIHHNWNKGRLTRE